MNPDELKAVFDRQASGYDAQQNKLAPVHEGLHYQLEWVLADLPRDARILCVGLGAGAELSYLASRYPGWRFTAVEPSGAMLDLCRRRAGSEGFISRCVFHEGYLQTLPDIELHDAATCFMVSHFMLDRQARCSFFGAIAQRLRPGATLVAADLASTVGSPAYEALLKAWVSMLHAGRAGADAVDKVHAAWQKDVAILPPEDVQDIIRRGGFDAPVQFYQAGLLHAWFARRPSGDTVNAVPA